MYLTSCPAVIGFGDVGHHTSLWDTSQGTRQMHAREQYLGTLSWLQAICKKFQEHCSKAGLQLPSKGFKLSYDTNIPRQAGLSGSSAIICAGEHSAYSQPPSAEAVFHKIYAMRRTWCNGVPVYTTCAAAAGRRCMAVPGLTTDTVVGPLTPFSVSLSACLPQPAAEYGVWNMLGLNCLMQYFEVSESTLPVQQRPSLVLSAEAELGITAGLQDRVIQVSC